MKDQHPDAEIIHVLREALTNLVARAEREICDPIDVDEIQVAKAALQQADAHAKAEER